MSKSQGWWDPYRSCFLQGKILIIDAIATNRIVLKVKLSSAYYDVHQAGSLAAARMALTEDRFDLIISALHLPDGGVDRLARDIPALVDQTTPPILAISNGPDCAARLAALSAGIREVLMRPLDDQLLLSRVRALIRSHASYAELESHKAVTPALAFAEPDTDAPVQSHVSVVSHNDRRAHSLGQHLRTALRCRLSLNHMDDVLGTTAPGSEPDAFILIMPDDPQLAAQVISLISALRANIALRHAVLMVVTQGENTTLAANALDMGADDVVLGAAPPDELSLRLSALLAAKHRSDRLRADVRKGLRAAVHDPLTGLHNRRYAMPQLEHIARQATQDGTGYAVMVADLDHFKRINDLYGHASGDAVLVETARRLRKVLRPIDLLARIGGEEFLIALPQTDAARARDRARRLCHMIGAAPFDIPGARRPIDVTISIGLTIGSEVVFESGDTLVDRADRALYSAKTCGRNQVTLARPAA